MRLGAVWGIMGAGSLYIIKLLSLKNTDLRPFAATTIINLQEYVLSRLSLDLNACRGPIQIPEVMALFSYFPMAFDNL